MKPNEAKVGDKVLLRTDIVFKFDDNRPGPVQINLGNYQTSVEYDQIELASEMLSRAEIAEKLAVVYHGCKTASSITTVHYCAFVLGIRDLFNARVEELRVENEDAIR